jgi:tight adherence protein B
MLVSILSIICPIIYILSAKHKRTNMIEQQLPDALDLIGRALLSGHAFSSALLMVGTEMSDPIASEFHIVSDEITYGISSQEALLNLVTRVPSTDLSYFVIAVTIQQETGGNLAELLSNISRLIRERMKLLATVRVLSAEGRLSAWILTLLPFVIGFALQIMNPKFLSVLWIDPTGLRMVSIALFLMVVGILAMWRIAKIRI